MIVALLAFCGGWSCRKEKPVADTLRKDVVADVGPVSITVDDMVAEAVRRHALAAAAGDPEAFLQRLTDREALIATALRRGLQHDEAIRRQYENMLIGRLRTDELEPLLTEVDVTPDDIEGAYLADEASYRISALTHVAVLRLQHGMGRGDKVREQLQAVREGMLKDPADGPGFGKLAIANSDHQASRYRGGDVGWLRDGQGPSWLPQAVIQAAWELEEPGQLSLVIEDDKAVFLVRMIEKKGEGRRPLESVSASIKARLLKEKRQQVEEQFLQRIRETVDITVHASGLSRAHERIKSRSATTDIEAPPNLP